MARVLKQRHLKNTRLLKEYASWMYCEGCNETIAYLCYVTYDAFDFHYSCKCGNSGQVNLVFDDSKEKSEEKLIVIKNRLCCPKDEAPLLTILDKKLASYEYSITCHSCGKQYRK